MKNLGEIRTLSELTPPDPEEWPRVSSIVPSKDEAAKLRTALESRLADPYPNAEFVLVDDRSTDDTGAILSELAAQDPRIVVERVDTLPDGWLGKVNALYRGVARASGDWLLVSDADVVFAPGTLCRAVALCESERIDFLTLIPEFRSRSVLVEMLWGVFIRVFSMAVSPFAVRNPNKKAAAGSGSFLLLRRSAYERSEGLEWLRMETGDDMALGMLMKHSGASCELMNGRGSLKVNIYDSLAEFYRGVEKNAGTLSAVPLWLFSTFLAAALAVEFAPLIAIGRAVFGGGASWLLGAGMAALTLQLVSTAAPLRKNGGRIWPAFLAPFGWLLMASGLFRSALLGKLRGGATWRGTFYSNEQLREGQRYKLL
jgi:hypothetical protein